MRIVLLGASGFVGRRATEQFRGAGLPVVAVNSAEIDLTHADAARALDVTLHDGDVLLFLSAITRDKGRDAATFMRNVAMGAHVAAAITSRMAHVVYISSDAVYGDAPSLPITERTACNPSCLYGAMHVARELMIAESCRAAQVPCCIVRPTLLYGLGDTHGSYGPNRFFRTAVEGSISLFGGGEERRDFVLVDDAARLIERVVRERTRGVLNVATGRSATFAAVANLVADAMPIPVRITHEARAVPIVHRDFDSSETFRLFPDFQYTLVDEGIAATAAALMPTSSRS